MTRTAPIRMLPSRGPRPLWFLAIGLAASAVGFAQPQPLQSTGTPKSPNGSSPVVLDRVVAVVNNRAILWSDLEDEIRLSVLDLGPGGRGLPTEQHALAELISRTMIEQQIRQQDLEAVTPTPDEVNSRLEEIRKQLPACIRQNCASDEGWKAFLAAHDLTPQRVAVYMRNRLEILRFIEQRFRQGIQISQQQIDDYYNQTLLPQYGPGEAVPPQSRVAPRIREILLQQQVNVLFDNWLDNLRQQGDVEVLDPNLASALDDTSAPGNDGRSEP